VIHCCQISFLTFLLLFFVGSTTKKQHCLLRYSESDEEHEGEIIDNGASNGAFDSDENSNVLRRIPLAPLSVDDVRNQQCRSSDKKVNKRHRIDYAGCDAEHQGEIIDNGASKGAFDNDENSNVLRRNPLAPLSVGDVRNQQYRSSGKKVKKRHRIDYAGSDAEHEGEIIDNGASNGAFDNDENSNVIATKIVMFSDVIHWRLYQWATLETSSVVHRAKKSINAIASIMQGVTRNIRAK
jgi:hypothetical protein